MKKSRLFFPSLAALAADQISKLWIAATLPLASEAEVFPFFNLVHTLNTGAAFSILADAGRWPRFLFLTLALIVSAYIATMLLRQKMRPPESLGYSLIMGGALGNAVDRAIKGAVTDFLDFHALGWHWPAFNIADVAITCGVGLVVWSTLRGISKPCH